MKNQALFSSKNKNKKLKCCQLQLLFGALRVKKYFFLPVNACGLRVDCTILLDFSKAQELL